MPELKLVGRQGKTMTVADGKVTIIKKGWFLATQREKSFPIRNISAVKVKKPGWMIAGFIQLYFAASAQRDSSWTNTGGAWDAAQDENAVLFVGQEEHEIALRIKDYIENYGA